MGITDRIGKALAANPLAWFAFAAFLITFHGNYQRGRELTRVCEYVLGELGDPVTIKSRPATDAEWAASICYERLSDPDDFSN